MKPAVDWTTRPGFTHIGMFLNDDLGCCTITQYAHLLEVRTAADSGHELDVPDAAVRRAYDAVSGGVDEGAALIDVMKYLRKVGVGGNRIEAFAELSVTNLQMLKWAIDVFGGVSLGVSLPLAAEEQFDQGEDWHVPEEGLQGPGEPGSWGGHALAAVGYDEQGLIVHSWKQRRRMLYDFFTAYAFEVWPTIDLRWVGPDRRAPSGLDLDALRAALARIT